MAEPQTSGAAADDGAIVVVGADASVAGLLRTFVDGAVIVLDGHSDDGALDEVAIAAHSPVRALVIDLTGTTPRPGVLAACARRWQTITLEDHGDGERPADRDGATVARIHQVRALDRTDLAGLVDALGGLGAERPPGERLRRIVLDAAPAIADEWAELCRWDPMLPPEDSPPFALEVVEAVGDAMGRIQPIGFGPDPAVEAMVGDFADAIGSVDLVIGELACLKEAIRRHVVPAIAPADAPEALARLDVVVDRAAFVATTRLMAQLWTEALADSLTGLWNRRAFQRDVAREAARAERHGRPYALAVIDLDGLKQINDDEGHSAGDAALRHMADAMRSKLRAGDTSYRIGGDEFVALLPETDRAGAEIVLRRLVEDSPAHTCGVASFPEDADGPENLFAAADLRLIDDRRRRRKR